MLGKKSGMCGEGSNYFKNDLLEMQPSCVTRDESCRSEELAAGRWVGALGGVGAGQLAWIWGVPGSCGAGAEEEARIISLPGQEAGERAGGMGPGGLFQPSSSGRRKRSRTVQCRQLAGPWHSLEDLPCMVTSPSLGGGRACPRACGKAFLCSLVICHPPCLLLCLQEGAKEFAALHNPRSKCSGRRRRRHHVVGASCSNAPASAVAETREGDSDRDTGNEWASSSSGTMPPQRQPSSLWPYEQ